MQISEQSHVPGHPAPLEPANGAQEVGKLFHEYFAHLYSDARFDETVEKLLHSKVDGGDERSSEHAERIFDPQTVRSCISAMKTGKSAASDGLLVDMLRFIPDESLVILSTLFKSRFMGHDQGDRETWAAVAVTLIPKVKDPKSVAAFRPISSIPVLAELYYKCIQHSLRHLDSLLGENMFAYRQGYQSLDEISSISQIIEKGNEWDSSICIGKTDVMKAYDRVPAHIIIKAMLSFGVPLAVIKSITREWYSQRQVFHWLHACSGAVDRRRGLPQGDPLSPMIFNMVVFYLLDPLMRRWKQQGFGINIGGADGLVSAFIFADDIILFGQNPDQLKQMFEDLEATLAKADLVLDARKSQWTHNLAVSFVEIEERQATLDFMKSQLQAEYHDLRRLVKGLQAEIRKLKETPAEHAAGAFEEDLVLEQVCQYDVENKSEEMKDARAKLRAIEKSIAGIDDEILAPDFKILVCGSPIEYVPSNKPMIILGSCISGNGQSKNDIDRRIDRAWRAFWSCKDKLLNKMVDPGIRMKALEIFVCPVLCYGSGAWTPTKADLSHIRRCHKRMAMMILGVQYRLPEEWEDFCSRTSCRIRTLWNKYGIISWDHAVLQKIHRWAGHVAR